MVAERCEADLFELWQAGTWSQRCEADIFKQWQAGRWNAARKGRHNLPGRRTTVSRTQRLLAEICQADKFKNAGWQIKRSKRRKTQLGRSSDYCLFYAKTAAEKCQADIFKQW